MTRTITLAGFLALILWGFHDMVAWVWSISLPTGLWLIAVCFTATMSVALALLVWILRGAR